jgi:iron complex outermembrane receptor protein
MKAHWQSLGLAGLVWMSNVQPVLAQVDPVAQAGLVSVTGIQLLQTDQGIQLELVTADGSSPTVFTSGSGRVLVLDVLNAQGSRQVLTDPAPGIASVTLEPRTDTSLRVTVLGREDLPPVQVSPSASGLTVASGETPVIAATPAPVVVDPVPTPSPQPTPDTPVVETPEIPVLELGEVLVTASRTAQDPQDVPRSVTIIDREEIEQQATISRDLADILARTVPGFYSTTSGVSNSGEQNIRGRPLQVLIDGVPIKTNLSTVQPRDLRVIDPSAIEQIEVVRGPSAIFGDGGTGGVINIITRQVTEPGLSSRLEIGTTTAANGSRFLGNDAISTFVNYGLTFQEQNFDVLLNLSRQDESSFFDAEGDRIPPAFESFLVPNSEGLNFLAKVGLDINENQRIQTSFNYNVQRNDLPFDDDISVNDEPELVKARAIPSRGLTYIGVESPRDRTTVADLTYTHNDFLNSRIQGQIYYRSLEGFSSFSDFRESSVRIPGLYTAIIDREQIGARLQAETSLSDTLDLVLGVDYSTESVSQFRPRLDEQTFDESGGTILKAAGGGVFQTPPYDFSSLGFFAQSQWEVTPRFKLSGGVRYDNLTLSAAGYSTFLGQPRDIEGGEVSFDDILFNIGAVYNITDELNVFLSFSQGFSAPDFGRFLRNPPAGFLSIPQDFALASPQKVDNYEIGIRGTYPTTQFAFSAFYNESELGLGSELDPFGGGFRVTREPQRYYGLEASVDWQPAVGLGVGSVLSYVEGKAEDEDGNWLALDSRTVTPLKLSAYVEHEAQNGWRNRLQAIYSGNRDSGFNDGNDPVAIQGYTIVDFISLIPLGNGQLSIGVENLFNELYFPVRSQALRFPDNDFSARQNVAGRGRSLRIGYTFEW